MKRIITTCFLSLSLSSCLLSCSNKTESGGTNLSPILVGDKYGFMDCTGKIIIEPQFDETGIMSEGLTYAVAGGRKVCIDSTGNYVFELPDSIDRLAPFTSGYAKFGDDQTMVLVLFISNDFKPISLHQ